MFIEFIADRTTHYLDRQYMLGPSLLVAPALVAENEETEYYLPAGKWTSLFDDSKIYEGPSWVKERVPLDLTPVWVRGGSIIVFGPAGVKRPDYALHKNLQVKLYEIEDGFRERVEIPSGDGSRIAGSLLVERHGYEIQLHIPYHIELAVITLVSSLYSIESATGGEVQGKDILVERKTVVIQLKEINMLKMM